VKRASKLAHLRQLASLELAAASVMPALLKAVREYVGADSAGFFWVDANGDMTNLYAERTLPPPLMRRYFDEHYGSKDHAFREKFLERARASDPVSSTSPSAAFMLTPYYREILSALDAHHVLYAVIHGEKQPLGQLSLYRSRESPAFSAADRAAVKDISRYLAIAARHAPQKAAEAYVDGEDEGLVIVDGAGRIVQAGAPSLHLLARALQRNFNAGTPSLALGDLIDGVALNLVQRVEAIRAGRESKPPREHVDGQWGRFHVSAYALGDSQSGVQIGLHVRRKEPLMVRVVEAMSRLELSPQQREVALLIAQNKSNSEIADALDVSANTAAYHVKQLYQRLDAHDRSSVVAVLLAGRPVEG
jgi:DNA-binding CsgD family transcriptional regulator/GAF domain-containing protein